MLNGNGKCGGSVCTMATIGKILLIIGGINWGLVGVGMLLEMDLNIVYLILGSMPVLESLVYILVGVSAIFSIIGCRCKTCMSGCACVVEDKVEDSMM